MIPLGVRIPALDVGRQTARNFATHTLTTNCWATADGNQPSPYTACNRYVSPADPIGLCGPHRADLVGSQPSDPIGRLNP